MAKQSNKLTAREVKNLSYNVDGAKKQRFPDGGGLYLLITENNSKYWRIDYRRPVSQKYNTLAIGTYPEVTLEQARLKRDEAKKMLANGVDPAEERNSIKNKQKTNLENTFQRYADEWLKIRELENKVDSETIRKLNKDILPFIGTMPVTKLTVEQLERDVTDAIVKRGALESARRIKSIIGMVLKLALRKRVITYNPAYDITLPQPIKTNHKAIVNEKELKELLVKIWRYCAENKRARKRTELAIKLSAYIYQRPNEVRNLLWESVDFNNQCLSFVASKTHQDHIVPLSRQTFDILKELEELRTTSKYVFPSVKTPLESMSEDTIRQALIRLGFQGRHTAHGFRATARTILGEEIEYRTDIVEHQLAHTVKDPNGTAYNRTKFLRRRKQLMQLWADYLDALRQGGDVSVFKPQDEENVIQFNQSNKSA
ncbi:MAG: integrase arm-type DNA-binding domain-containing protein [Acinetobacter sp.]|uniref:tyrosine-type recombinase/integrase n=1 Tax=Acinetobacter sp. TaxID=472 RepID=UPI000EB825D4|nr:integrase arm-type DNA-binding domain-containing protein [Acinetobacter sp.]MBC6675616.1 integrase arm-type DNA-binding domain-containing protein [Acinetobacter sp.]HAE63788.1 integrase [Acinetobacter johnsonii]